ncbi:uncharacterized protein MELLADRAFT_110889 [Melampsora larici-populina 98AG31]|uniref:Uncharacterized protein n=1 Tax=Melampsora larici-populina (strain 98AG31 / pathotype 3-4-7) TaxID=747676 RepID=F4S1C1_MELLP|nr:uncharacterized protein MELLADRAFT_110889 [Melampsora larici-populina 98AG31]EGG01587.1 hypothetical protein MELLADRAFT_110889 [Melampsora larici-populina 98AG31]
MALMFQWPISLTAMGGRELSHFIPTSPASSAGLVPLTETRDPALSQYSLSTLFDELSLGPSTASTSNLPASSDGQVTQIDSMPGRYGENSSNCSLQDSPSTYNPRLDHEFERLSIFSDEYSSRHSDALPERHGISLGKSPSGFLDNGARPVSKDEQNSDQDQHIMISQNTLSPQDAWVKPRRPGQLSLKRTRPSYRVDLQPSSSKRPTHRDPSLFDGDDVFISQVTDKSPQKAVDSDRANPSLLPYELIDTYKPRIQNFMDSISQHQINLKEHQRKFLISNLQKLWDDYLVMITACSELISADGIHTNLAEDLLDAFNWILVKWSEIPKTNLREKAPWRAGSVYHDTVWWLTHPVGEKERNSLAAEFIKKFMADKRQDWVERLIPHKKFIRASPPLWRSFKARQAERRGKGIYEMTDE